MATTDSSSVHRQHMQK